MKVSTSLLQKALTRVSRAAEKMPNNRMRYAWHDEMEKGASVMYVYLRGEHLYFFCTSDEMFAQEKIPVEIVDDKDFDAYVFPKHIIENLKFLQGRAVFYKTEKSVMLKDLENKKRVRIVDKQKFSEFFDGLSDKFSVLTNIEPVTVNAGSFKDAIRKTEYIARDKAVQSNAVLFRTIDGKLCIGATDSFRASIIDNVAPCDQEVDTAIGVNAAVNFINMLSSEDGDIKLYFTDNAVYMQDGDFVCGALVTNDTYDVWKAFDIHEKPDNVLFVIEQDILQRALRITSDIAENGNGRIIIEIKDKDVSFFAISNELGWSRWGMNPMGFESTEEEMKIALNPKFLLQYTSRTKPKQAKFFIGTPSSPVFIEGEDSNLRTLVMPISLS